MFKVVSLKDCFLFYFSVCDDVICAPGAQCIPSNFGPTCKCLEGFLGNPFPGGKCTIDVCSITNPCEKPQICIGGRCKSRCEGIICGVGAHCDVNSNQCVCDDNFVGTPELICMPRKFFLYIQTF